MPVKNAVAKVWNITPSYDGKRWSTYPAGDKPAGGGLAPTWNDPSAIGPGWVYQASYAVGVPMTADFGAALNSPNPSGYSYQVLRNGDTVVQSGSNVSGFTYTPVSADQYQQLSFTLTASNGAGSDTTTAASVTIN